MGRALVLALAFLLTSAAAGAADLAPVGRWTTIDDNTGKPTSVVTIVEKDGKLVGTIESLVLKPEEDQHPLCTKCSGDKKDKPIIGMTILWDLARDGDEWSGGRILDPDNGETYKCYIALAEGGKKLKVRGYIGFSLLGRTQIWNRVE
jgi:uncharacterized protein (DUF2147 family)